MLLAGGVEIGVASMCFCGRARNVSLALLAMLAFAFLIYRVGLFAIGFSGSCPCLGSLADALHIPPRKADSLLKGIIGYLLLGTYFANRWNEQISNDDNA